MVHLTKHYMSILIIAPTLLNKYERGIRLKRESPKLFIRISELCFVMSSSSFLFIPTSNFNGSYTQQITAYLVGILFWGGLLSGIVSLIILDFKRRKTKFRKSCCPGMLRFFRNKKAKICDFCMIASVLAFIISEKQLGLYHTLSLVLLTVTVLSIYFHSILNGNNYAYAFQKGV